MSNTTAEKKKLEQVFALWKRKSKDGKKTYFTGTCDEKETFLTAFYNTEKKNLKEPDMKVYTRDKDGNLSKEPLVSLWCNATNNGKKVLSGKLDGKRVVGFINANATEKQPYISVYWSDELPVADAKTEDKTENKPKYKKKEAPKFEEVETDEDLPF